MQYKVGMIVKSESGHDSNGFYVIIKIENGFVYIADGKRRKIEKPKAKNIKHIKPTNKILEISDFTSNNKLRQVLSEYNNPNRTQSV